VQADTGCLQHLSQRFVAFGALIVCGNQWFEPGREISERGGLQVPG
jgi:hypothetical protein